VLYDFNLKLSKGARPRITDKKSLSYFFLECWRFGGEMAVRLAGFPGVNQKMTSITRAGSGKMELPTSLLSIAKSQKSHLKRLL
jgi:hypothetical protein